MSSLILWSVVGVVVAVLVVVGLVLVSQSKSNNSGAPTAPGVVTPTTITSNDRTLGNANAPVAIDLYSDFRCSYCLMFTVEGTEKNLVENYVATGKAKLVYHDFLTIDADGTNASRDAANAAWCAADQGKFWTMHDWLYANQGPSEDASAFTKSRLAEIAKAAGLDMSKFQPCLDSGTHNDAIAAEQTSKLAEVKGTPTVYVNGKLVVNNSQVSSYTYADIKAAIDGIGASPAPSASVVPSVSASAKPS